LVVVVNLIVSLHFFDSARKVSPIPDNVTTIWL
jgi:hypothetical protein